MKRPHGGADVAGPAKTAVAPGRVMLTGLGYSLGRVHWPRALAIALPFPVLAVLPLPAKTNAPPPAKVIPANVISLSGHVFNHGCANVTAKLNGQNIRVSRDGDFAVLLKPPRRPVMAFMEFSSPECGGAIEEIRVEPGLARYTVTASLYPAGAKQERRREALAANAIKIKRERLPQNVWALNDLISRYAGAAGLERSLVYAMIHTESNFNTHARSRANAVGLMQLIPDQGARAAADYLDDSPAAITVSDLRNPATNLRLGTAYLQLLSDRYFSKVQNEEARMALALAAYNWGPGNVQNAIRLERHTPRTLAEVKQMLARRAPLETRRYVDKVTKRMAWYEEIV